MLNKAAYVHTHTFNNCRKKTVHIAEKKTAKRVYKKQYDEQVLNSLIKIWKFFNFQCGIRCETQERNKYEYKAHGISTTRPAENFNQLIPIRVYYDRDECRPGIFETDTVSHDGGNVSGEYCFTLTATDICTQWTELRALKNKAQCWTKKALEDIRISLPYRPDAIHPDNGSEFKNAQVFEWAQEQRS